MPTDLQDFLEATIVALFGTDNKFIGTAFQIPHGDEGACLVTACHNIDPQPGRTPACHVKSGPFQVVAKGERLGNDLATLFVSGMSRSRALFSVDSNVEFGTRVIAAGFYPEKLLV